MKCIMKTAQARQDVSAARSPETRRRSSAGGKGAARIAVAPAGATTIGAPQDAVLVDQTDLQQLVGYSCRRAHAVVRDHLAKCLAAHDLPPGWFTVLMLLSRNPGLSSRQLCQVLA